MKSVHAKHEQVSRFIAMITQMGILDREELHIVDCGCGKAYLSFALFEYLQTRLHKKIYLTGLDTNRDVIRYCTAEAEKRGFDTASFYQTAIRDFKGSNKADIVIALHACDTATDDALALGLSLNATAILAAPCCHHYVNARLKRSTTPALMLPIIRDGITRERFADLLTDTMRSQILRAYGYETHMTEFVAQEHTSKNIMISAIRKSEQVPDETLLEHIRNERIRWNAAPKLAEYMSI
ncbi:MAG: SAM-dependent methyltransferase [Candidatus Kapabacteria bacterium]|nr:SAM-dependent methyltransferase [Candidatus Kapabacteria bacterium]